MTWLPRLVALPSALWTVACLPALVVEQPAPPGGEAPIAPLTTLSAADVARDGFTAHLAWTAPADDALVVRILQGPRAASSLADSDSPGFVSVVVPVGVTELDVDTGTRRDCRALSCWQARGVYFTAFVEGPAGRSSAPTVAGPLDLVDQRPPEDTDLSPRVATTFDGRRWSMTPPSDPFPLDLAALSVERFEDGAAVERGAGIELASCPLIASSGDDLGVPPSGTECPQEGDDASRSPGRLVVWLTDVLGNTRRADFVDETVDCSQGDPLLGAASLQPGFSVVASIPWVDGFPIVGVGAGMVGLLQRSGEVELRSALDGATLEHIPAPASFRPEDNPVVGRLFLSERFLVRSFTLHPPPPASGTSWVDILDRDASTSRTVAVSGFPAFLDDEVLFVVDQLSVRRIDLRSPDPLDDLCLSGERQFVPIMATDELLIGVSFSFGDDARPATLDRSRTRAASASCSTVTALSISGLPESTFVNWIIPWNDDGLAVTVMDETDPRRVDVFYVPATLSTVPVEAGPAVPVVEVDHACTLPGIPLTAPSTGDLLLPLVHRDGGGFFVQVHKDP